MQTAILDVRQYDVPINIHRLQMLILCSRQGFMFFELINVRNLSIQLLSLQVHRTVNYYRTHTYTTKHITKTAKCHCDAYHQCISGYIVVSTCSLSQLTMNWWSQQFCVDFRKTASAVSIFFPNLFHYFFFVFFLRAFSTFYPFHSIHCRGIPHLFENVSYQCQTK